MTPDRWRQVREVLDQALLVKETERSACLAGLCRDDSNLRAEVESLLASAARTDIEIDSPLIPGPLEVPELQSGDSVGGYVVVQRVGEGGSAVVFEAVRSSDGLHVALKVLARDAVMINEFRTRFLREARLTRHLHHPNIVRILDTVDSGERPAIAMELVSGRSLADVIPPGGLPAAEVRAIAVQLSSALAFAHAQGIIHRDLKPDNIRVLPDGLVKVLDFGSAKPVYAVDGGPAMPFTRTATGMIVGSPAHMSPEQALGQTISPASDVFSFGVVLYELMTGHSPFMRATTLQTLSAITSDEVTPVECLRVDVPPKLADLSRRCLCKQPQRRPSMSSVHTILEQDDPEILQASLLRVAWRRLRRSVGGEGR